MRRVIAYISVNEDRGYIIPGAGVKAEQRGSLEWHVAEAEVDTVEINERNLKVVE